MKKSVRLFAAILSLCLLLSACAQSGSVSRNGVIVTTSLEGKEVLVGNIPCEFPLVKEPVSLNMMIVGYADMSADDVYVWDKYKEMTGVDINWTTINKSERNEKITTALTNKSDYDLILRGRLTSTKLTQYGESGLIIDLAKDDLLKNYAPNCWAYLQAHPDSLASVMNPDGAIYSLPQINSGAELRVARKIFVNKTWLENVNMELPTTTQELYELLKAFKEQDANGNGDPNDEIPLCPYDWASMQDAFFGSFGLANRGVHNQLVDMDEQTGKVRLIASSDSYKSYLEYLNTLYSEKLLDNYVFTISEDQWINNANNDLIGVFASTNLATLPSDKADNWVAIEQALEGPGGDKLCTAIRANFHSTGAAVIPSTCKNPELVLRWLDYFWTDEGTLFYHMGIENESFIANEDGTYDYAQKLYDEISSGSSSFDDIVAKYSPYPGGGNPTVEVAPYFMGGEMAEIPAQAAKKLFEYGPSEYWPSFTFTTEESETLEGYQSDIKKYIESSKVDFISGTRSFDKWDEYTEKLSSLGEDGLLSVYQAAVDRYYALLDSQDQ